MGKPNRHLHYRCAGCVKVQGGECQAITYPAWVWRHGGCWARSEDPMFWARYYRAMREYEERA